MSAPAKTSDEQIRAAARRLLDDGGPENVSMQSVAAAVGVQAPSLYKRFGSKADLLDRITDDALRELHAVIEPHVRPEDPTRSLHEMANAYRSFAHRNRQAYGLIFTPNSGNNLDARRASAAPLLRILTGALGESKALPAARTLVAFLHGFITMELTGLFQFGGDLDEAFQFGLTTILNALMAGPDLAKD